uniref:ADP-ribosylhydrolase ARH3 n=1 Tax=Neolamprologus brichardi TaxID=32507 RepID=A0A3Q4GWG2_NEOBR
RNEAAAAAGGPASLSRFRGALVAGVLGDCIGGEFEGAEEVPMESVLQHLSSLDDETKGTDEYAAVRLEKNTLNTPAPFRKRPKYVYIFNVCFCSLKEAEKPFCERLHRIRDLMDRSKVSIEEVISELGNGIAALHSVPTAIFCVLHCLQPRECLPESYGGVERTIAYSLALGGDTDTIACMAGAIAGAHYGIETIPQSWIRCCEGVEDADQYAERLYKLYHQSPLGGKDPKSTSTS